MPMIRSPAHPGPEVLVLTNGILGPQGLLGEWLDDRQFQTTVVQMDANDHVPDPERFAFVASLGAPYSPRDVAKPYVARELMLPEICLQRDVPILGLCFGGQALATVLGGEVRRFEKPDHGWHDIGTPPSWSARDRGCNGITTRAPFQAEPRSSPARPPPRRPSHPDETSACNSTQTPPQRSPASGCTGTHTTPAIPNRRSRPLRQAVDVTAHGRVKRRDDSSTGSGNDAEAR
jgi:hypothetical protein